MVKTKQAPVLPGLAVARDAKTYFGADGVVGAGVVDGAGVGVGAVRSMVVCGCVPSGAFPIPMKSMPRIARSAAIPRITPQPLASWFEGARSM
jgi:hypothetical protein